MKFLLIIATVLVSLTSCKKDKFTIEPQIRFKSISPNTFSDQVLSTESGSAPKLTITITDEDGDIGFVDDSTFSKIYTRNLNTNKIDSLRFPDILKYTGKRINADVTINLFNELGCKNPGPARPRVDTTYFEVYVTDFAKNKSNTLTTSDPVYFICE